MTKQDFKTVVNELRDGKSYPGTDTEPLHGCALSDYPKGQIIRKEVIVEMLRWQCLFLNGGIDEQELTNMLQIFKTKRIIMV